MIRSEWSINAALANVEARDRELELSDAIIEELRQVIEDQQDELNDLVRFIKRFNHPEEFGHLLDSDAKQAVMKILSIYKEYDK